MIPKLDRKMIPRSAVSVILECEAREPYTPAGPLFHRNQNALNVSLSWNETTKSFSFCAFVRSVGASK